MKFTVTFSNEGKPDAGVECIVLLRNELFRAYWSGLCWVAEGRPNFIAPDWWAEAPNQMKDSRP